MSKRRSRLLPISLLCIAGLVLLGWKWAPWNRPAAVPLAKWKLDSAMNNIVWTRDGTSLVTHRYGNAPSRWTWQGESLPATTSRGDSISTDGHWLIRLTPRVMNASRSIELENLETGAVERTLALPPESPGGLLAPNPLCTFLEDGRRLHIRDAVGPAGTWNDPHELEAVWDTRTGQLLKSRVINKGSEDVFPEGFVMHGEHLLRPRFVDSGEARDKRDPSVRTATRRVLRLEGEGLVRTSVDLAVEGLQLEPPLQSMRILTAVSSPRTDLLVAGIYGRTSSGLGAVASAIYGWDIRTGAALWTLQRVSPTTVAFSPDGRLVAIGGNFYGDSRLRAGHTVTALVILDARTGRDISVLTDDTPLQRYRRATAYKWSRFTDRTPVRLPRTGQAGPPEQAVFQVAWSPDVRRLAAVYFRAGGSRAFDVTVWPVPSAATAAKSN